MEEFIDLDRWPIVDLKTAVAREIVQTCQDELARSGMFNLAGFVRVEALVKVVATLEPMFAESSFLHARRHNIYFDPELPGVPRDHPVRLEFDTSNNTLCADQFLGSPLLDFYEYPPLADFIGAVMEMPRLYTMADPLARVNVMSYQKGQALNWHFDRSEFTTTLLLQEPASGGDFQYAKDLRSEGDANYDGVARMLAGEADNLVTLPLRAGTLNVFRGKNTAHRVTPVARGRRIVSVLSYYQSAGVKFSDAERLGFFGRLS